MSVYEPTDFHDAPGRTELWAGSFHTGESSGATGGSG